MTRDSETLVTWHEAFVKLNVLLRRNGKLSNQIISLEGFSEKDKQIKLEAKALSANVSCVTSSS